MLSYIDGKRVVELMSKLDVARSTSTINQWLRWYETKGANAFRSRKAPRVVPE